MQITSTSRFWSIFRNNCLFFIICIFLALKLDFGFAVIAIIIENLLASATCFEVLRDRVCVSWLAGTPRRKAAWDRVGPTRLAGSPRLAN